MRQLRWSPRRPAVLYALRGRATIEAWDLTDSTAHPAAQNVVAQVRGSDAVVDFDVRVKVAAVVRPRRARFSSLPFPSSLRTLLSSSRLSNGIAHSCRLSPPAPSPPVRQRTHLLQVQVSSVHTLHMAVARETGSVVLMQLGARRAESSGDEANSLRSVLRRGASAW